MIIWTSTGVSVFKGAQAYIGEAYLAWRLGLFLMGNDLQIMKLRADEIVNANFLREKILHVPMNHEVARLEQPDMIVPNPVRTTR
jgi:hypothetical protein